MERTALLAYLRVAKRRAKQGTKNVDRQKHIISKLVVIGSDTAQAESLLEAFQQVQTPDFWPCSTYSTLSTSAT